MLRSTGSKKAGADSHACNYPIIRLIQWMVKREQRVGDEQSVSSCVGWSLLLLLDLVMAVRILDTSVGAIKTQ